jgi:hypothetical protein
MSLDALRGFDMFWIIGGGAIFQGLAHALDGPLDVVRPQSTCDGRACISGT